MKNYRDRIVTNPQILLGKPVIKGTRIPVYLIVNLMAQRRTAEEIVTDYPDLTKEDIAAALSFAAESVNYTEQSLLGSYA